MMIRGMHNIWNDKTKEKSSLVREYDRGKQNRERVLERFFILMGISHQWFLIAASPAATMMGGLE